MTRYSKAQDNARLLDPETLQREAAGTFQLAWHQRFRIPLLLDHVADAVRRGIATAPEIRSWCHRTLAPIFASTGVATRQALLQ